MSTETSSPSPPSSAKDLLRQVTQHPEDFMSADTRRFVRKLKKKPSSAQLEQIAQDMEYSQEQRLARQDSVPELRYPEELPVSQRRDDILQTLKDNQVTIIAGETGSGKTTQIPKMLLELGYGTRGLIGHTQPRRIAARSVAERLSEELQDSNNLVGHTIRFNDKTQKNTLVKVMTDGILLAEIHNDPLLTRYDAIIIDEAHERSLNIDFLLGYLKEILPKRPDLKVIITSATIDPESFAQHFGADINGIFTPAPVIEVSGRTYGVDIRYRPLEPELPELDAASPSEKKRSKKTFTPKDPIQGILEASVELLEEGPGDILVFLASEAEIHDAQRALDTASQGRQPHGISGGLDLKRLRGIETLSLFGRQSSAEQQKIFSPHSSTRIILSTNIAETSLTVPGIKYVIDAGTARISRYSHRTKVQRLPIEPISQASALQRSGRAGRTSPGIAIRLYSKQDFLDRPEYTDPEILRTHLSSVILTMANLNLGNITDFPFIQPPDKRTVKDGIAVLQELGALQPQSSKSESVDLTRLGRTIARIPTDPRFARMLAEGEMKNVLPAIIIIVAALSIQDVRERPQEFHAQADQAHARFAADSDFLSILKLWEYITTQQRELSGNQFRKLTQREFLHYMRIRDWMDMVNQFTDIINRSNTQKNRVRMEEIRNYSYNEADSDMIHRSILTGLLSHIGMRDGESFTFRGTRNTQFKIHPSSVLARKPGQWIMANDIVETSQVFGRTVATIDPNWIESAAEHLLKKSYSEPFWSHKQSRAMAHEKVTLLGLPIIADRKVALSSIDPELSRELFIRHALVYGQWSSPHVFLQHNADVLDDARQLEEKTRRRDLVISEDDLFSFYNQKLPESIVSAGHFDSWWKKERRTHPHLLNFDPTDLINQDSAANAHHEFPDTFSQGSLEFDVTYQFNPSSPDDGMTFNIPLPLLHTVDTDKTSWLAPGLRLELATALIRSLPKHLRKSVLPAPDFASTALETMYSLGDSFQYQLAEALRALGGAGISAQDFDLSKLPQHLLPNYAVLDKRGSVIAQSRDLSELQHKYAGDIHAVVSQKPTQKKRKNSDPGNPYSSSHTAGKGTTPLTTSYKTWDEDSIGTLPETIEISIDGQLTHAYPALVRNEQSISVHHFPTSTAAQAQQFSFVLQEMTSGISLSSSQMLKGLPLQNRVAVEHYPHGGVKALVSDALTAVSKTRLLGKGGVIRDPSVARKLIDENAQYASGEAYRLVQAYAPGLADISRITAELSEWEGESVDDMTNQLSLFTSPGFLSQHGLEAAQSLPRYVAAMFARLDMLDMDPDKEFDNSRIILEAQTLLKNKLDSLPRSRAASPTVKKIRWMIEELRVSLFAQHLGTRTPVSIQRIKKALDNITV